MKKDPVEVTIFSSLTCPWCMLLKDYLHTNNIFFEEKDVTFNHTIAKEMFKKSGKMIIPQIWIGEKIVYGLDWEELKTALKNENLLVR